MAKRKPQMFPSIPVAGKDYELKLPNPYLSYTQISMYQKCPWQYYLRYILKQKQTYGVPLFYGGVVGMVMEEVNLWKLKKKKDMKVKDALKHLNAFFDEKEAEVDDWQDTDADFVLKQATQFVKQYMEEWAEDIEPVRMPNRKPGVEWEFTIDIAGVPVRGFVDLVCEHNGVVDYKVKNDTRLVKVEDDLQLRTYAEATGIVDTGFIIFQKKSGKITQMGRKKKLNLKKNLKWLEAVVSRTAQAISLGVFPMTDPQINYLCKERYCSYWKGCYGKCR